ncbi:hypothetical protein TNCV_4396511 [Trichonephila clavipes]|uniref:Uncharacterized protein n=1 Tax=Trichonephila clavipes TaxID=2585209 RepID=A0A8X6W5G9_TRICX|nr:hypothetical protein TNCV_4396511 [Trichonephila clavipes]
MVDIDILIQIWKNRVKKIDFVLKWLSRVGSEIGPTEGFCEGDTRNRWRDGQVCPDVDKELWRLGPDGSGVLALDKFDVDVYGANRRRVLACYGQEEGGEEKKRRGDRKEEEKNKRVRERERTEGGGETEKRERRRKESRGERVKPALNGKKG